MPHSPTPWIGLAALLAMFVLPYLPNWLFEGPRTIRHRPRRHVCADCNASWTDDHRCPAIPEETYPPRAELLRKPQSSSNLERRQLTWLSK
jgi:hypothetical protein